MTPVIEWQFGGWLRGWPTPVAWSVLGLCALLGLTFIIWLYGHTLQALPKGVRLMLTTLRAAIVLTLLLCLADPARIERRPPDGFTRNTLAVLIDRSDSMNTPDYHGLTRLASAVRLWKQHEPEASKAFPRTVYRQFSVTTDTVPSLDAAVQSKLPGPETHLYDALHQTLDLAPGAIVCLTDGLDTTAGNSEALAVEAQQRGVPLYFVLATNRGRSGEMTNVREVKAPSQVLRQTRFTASALLEVAASREGNLPVEFWSGGTRLAAAQLPMRVGLNTISWPVQTEAKEAGPMPLEFRVGAGDRQQIAACTTQIVDRTKIDVLYYQGAMQWGYHYLLGALESDPSFRVTSILNPALGVQISAGSAGHDVWSDLPEDAGALKRFQIIVLAHVFADRLSVGQQRALAEYARAGGGVLFVSPDTEAARRFAGTELEQMLPVAFEAPGAPRGDDDRAQNFRDLMAATNPDGDPGAYNERGHLQTLPSLQPFALPPGAKDAEATAIFRNITPMNLPKFCAYAEVRAVKPGADILAVKGRSAAGPGSDPPRVLLAKQQFGAGFTAALATDLLWRWKMSLPSGSHAAETFWQQLLLALTPPPGEGLRLVKLTELPSIHAGVAFRVEGAAWADAPPSVETISPGGEHRPLALHAASGAGARGGVWTTEMVPDAAGRWEVRATDPARNLARVSFPVGEKAVTMENLDLPPDVEGMRRLAQSTGGTLIEEEPVFRDPAADAAADAQTRRVQPLWNSGWLLGLLLGLYGVELALRRWFRLL